MSKTKRSRNKNIIHEVNRNQEVIPIQPLKKKYWSAQDKALDKFVSKMKPNSYWKQSWCGGETYVHFGTSSADFYTKCIKGWIKAVNVDHEKEEIQRETPSLFADYGYSFDSNQVIWTKTTKDRFDFWWNLGKEVPVW